MLRYEKALWTQGCTYIAGVDEAGAGPLAGPVVAAAVILPVGWRLAGVNDSKKLAPRRREELAVAIREQALAWGIGSCAPSEIDTLNILQASREAMRRAVIILPMAPEQLLVDARVVPGVEIPQQAIVHGDALSLSIAAASILAKVERDHWMKRLAQRYPGYGFEKHRGYGTRAHLEALERLGPCPIHRQSFGPVARLISRCAEA